MPKLFRIFMLLFLRVLSPGVNLDSEEPQPPSLRAEPSQPEEAELGFWLVRPGGGLEGAATDRDLGGRGTFHSSWAREELDTGDHFDSLGLAAGRTQNETQRSCLSRAGGEGGVRVKIYTPEVLCAVLVREPLWLEARMDDQALLEGIVVFSDEDGPAERVSEGERALKTKEAENCTTKNKSNSNVNCFHLLIKSKE